MARANFISSSLIYALLIGVAFSASASAAEPSPWLEIHSKHYTVVTDAGEKAGKDIALRFEQMRAVFGSLLMKERLSEPLPLTILAFRNDKSYYQAAPLRNGQPIGVPGFFLSGEDQNFIVLNLSEQEPWRAITYDFGLMLLNFNYPPVPAWFDEGLAEYFSSIRVEDNSYEIGRDPGLQSTYREHLNTDRGADGSKSFTDILSGEMWLPLSELLGTKHDATSTNEIGKSAVFAAQSWMTMHYLIHERKLPESGTYFDLVENQHVPVEEAIQKAYGVTATELDHAVKDYFQSLKPILVAGGASKQPDSQKNPQQAFQFPELIGPSTSVITSNSLPENDARAITAEVEIRIPDRREAGLKELNTLATMADPTANKSWFIKPKKEGDSDTPLTTAVGNEIAHRALAWDHLQHGEVDACLQELGDAATLSQRDLWIRYYLSVLKYRISQAKKTDMEGLPNMLQDLRAVLEWHPEFASAYDLMAMARMEGGGPAAAMQAERAAIQLSPRNQEYVFHLAEIYESDKRWDASRALLQHLESSADPQIAAQARERLGELSTNQRYGVADAKAASTSKLSPQSSPFDVLEQDAAKRSAEEKTTLSGNTADMRPSKFVKGELVDVDCSQSPAAILTVSSGGRVLKLRTADYKSLLLIGADKFSCEWSERSVSVNYKPGGLADGDLVSVEVR